MQKSNVHNSCERTFRRMRSTGSSPLSIFLLSIIAIMVTLPMISCVNTVNSDQYSRQSFTSIGCKGTYNRKYMKVLSQICFDHSSEGYHDPRYSNCRKKCFTTVAFRSTASMLDFEAYGTLNADAWQLYLVDIAALNGFDPVKYLTKHK